VSKFLVGDIVRLNDEGLEVVYGSSYGLSHMKHLEMEVTSVSPPMTDTGDCVIQVDNLEIDQFLNLDVGFDLVKRGKTTTMYVTGTVIDMSADGKRIRLDDGEWYGAFTASMLSGILPGMTVGFDYADGKIGPSGKPYRNIRGKVTPATAGGSAPTHAPIVSNSSSSAPKYQEKVGEPILSNSRCIIRQNSLTNAVNLFKSYVDKPTFVDEKGFREIAENIIQIAELFEAYSSGDADEEEAKKELGITE
jgi:hypothetical protein